MKTIALYRNHNPESKKHSLTPLWNKSIFIHTSDFIYRVSPKDIIYIRAESNYSTIFLTKERKILASKTLKYFSELLSPYNFVRAHQSFLVNILRTEGISLNENMEIIMDSGDTIPVSRSKKHLILNHFKNH